MYPQPLLLDRVFLRFTEYYTPRSALVMYHICLKFTLKRLKCPYTLRSLDHLQGECIVPCQSYTLKL
jgi:hypothetical protein